MTAEEFLALPEVRLSELRAGDRLVADDGFDCIDEGAVLEVHADEDDRPWVPCRGPDGAGEPGSERHYMDGQEDRAGEALVGLRRAPS